MNLIVGIFSPFPFFQKENVSHKSSSGSSSGTYTENKATTNLRRKSSASRHRAGLSNTEASKASGGKTNEESGKVAGSNPVGIPGNIVSGSTVAGTSAASSSVHNKLEQDYIQMYLGMIIISKFVKHFAWTIS